MLAVTRVGTYDFIFKRSLFIFCMIGRMHLGVWEHFF